MISAIVTQVCSSLTTALTSVPFFGSSIASIISQICTQIVSLLTGFGL
ncbi:MAG: hypothetical protein U1A27_11280 [Phycisphaerae bacterium]